MRHFCTPTVVCVGESDGDGRGCFTGAEGGMGDYLATPISGYGFGRGAWDGWFKEPVLPQNPTYFDTGIEWGM